MGTLIKTASAGNFLVAAFIVAFVFLAIKHYEIDMRRFREIRSALTGSARVAGSKLGILHSCEGKGEFRALAADLYVCTRGSNQIIYGEIYNSYPASAGGRERIYTFLDSGDIAIADKMLNNVYDFERYEPVVVRDPPTWEEDPFGERYWRFLFYGLRNTRHLVAAALETHDQKYFEKLRDLVRDSLDNGMGKPHAWDDYHGVAFRTMVLVNSWWKLRQEGELPIELSDKILAALEEHGNFLLEPAHYEGGNNHGITEASALLVAAVNFPDLPNAPIWRDTAIRRIDLGLQGIVDEDGVLVENSPYYHLYVMEKYWEIFNYTKKFDVSISDSFETTLNKMVSHATYILQPDRDMPLLGASIPRMIERSGEFRSMAEENSSFNYVLTEGQDGSMPPKRNVFYPSSGIAIFRSGWGERRPFADETHVVFDTGPYRTDHSDLDGFTISAYAENARVIREAGLFTYEVEHPLYDYFHGTRGHNTVMVDNTDQARDRGVTAGLREGDGWAYVSAMHEMYPRVRHSRAVALIGTSALLVVDDLASPLVHTYEQLWHLPPNASISEQSPQKVSGAAPPENGRAAPSVPFSILQFGVPSTLRSWSGDEQNQRGLCAAGYEILRACPELSYEMRGESARYITVILFGKESGSWSVSETREGVIRFETPEGAYTAAISYPDARVFGSGYIDISIEREGRPGANFWNFIQNTLARLRSLF